MAQALGPDAYSPPLREAQTWMDAAVRADPEGLLYRVDMAEFVLLRTGQIGAGRVSLAAVRDSPEPEMGWRPEDRWAQARAEELLADLSRR